ncbi:MAG: very short patch repair endonuclease [Alphaproteobacteria bacterium]
MAESTRKRRVPRAPPPTSEGASAAMRGNKKTDTKPELIVRRLLHKLGYRFRLHARDLPGNPDIVFRSWKIAIFVHGCFWHQHSDPNCPLRSEPRSNTLYWKAKLARNVERDAETSKKLKKAGWKCLVVWECETQDTEALRSRLLASRPLIDAAVLRASGALEAPKGSGKTATKPS